MEAVLAFIVLGVIGVYGGELFAEAIDPFTSEPWYVAALVILLIFGFSLA